MTALLVAVVAVPFAAAVLALLIGHRSVAAVRAVAVLSSAAGLLLAVLLALPRLGDVPGHGAVLAATGGAAPPVELALFADALSVVVLLLTTSVAFFVQVFSTAYLRHDPRYPSYAALVCLFTGAMSLVVVADDLWVLLVGWELMGACSYFLIGHHWEREDARAGAVKAFLMTRLADLGLLFAILLLGARFESYRISTVMAEIAAGGLGRDELALPAMLVAVAVIGKSAQFPLHTWLPDAMPGPTPISALIHAATMVAAGVFLVARTYPLFVSAPAALNLLALVAVVTMLVSAMHALTSGDLKRVLAWSTVSQLAYMFAALAVGAWAAGVLHLLAHGAFKALLFLAAGSVAHAVGSTELARMGGLRRSMPVTFTTMTLGFAALAGLAPMVGFFTKDAVIGAALDAAGEGRLVWPWLAWAVFSAGVVTAVLTVAYAARAWLLVFFGPALAAEPAQAPAAEEPSRVVHPHEPPGAMTGPLVLLAVPTLLGGVVVLAPQRLLGGEDPHLVHADLSVAMTVLVVGTLAAVVWLWRRAGRGEPWPAVRVPHPAVDRLYDTGVVRPTWAAARAVVLLDRDVIDAYADGAGASARGTGWLLRRAQTGNVQTYVMVVLVGAVALAVAAGVAT